MTMSIEEKKPLSGDEVAYSVVVPVYNSAESLVELCQRLKKVFEETLHASYEIILVDDASPNPKTWPVMEEIQRSDPRVSIFQLMRNAGQHNATMCGLRHAAGRYAITMDDDLQHPPEEIPRLLAAMKEFNSDAVFAVPLNREHGTYRNVGSYLLNKLLGFTIDKPSHITLSSFRIMTNELRSAVIKYEGHIVTISALICQSTRNIANIRVQHDRRKSGKSNYSLPKLIKLAIANVFNFSAAPLQLMSVVGVAAFLFSLCYACWIVYRKLTGVLTQPGFSTLVVLLSFYSGLILLSISILGQYILRILKVTTFGWQYNERRQKGLKDR